MCAFFHLYSIFPFHSPVLNFNRWLFSPLEFSPSTSVTCINSASPNFTSPLYKINVFQVKILNLLLWLYPHDDNACLMPLFLRGHQVASSLAKEPI